MVQLGQMNKLVEVKPSSNAVQDYAGEMRADPRAYYGYYYWLVVYARLGGAVILPPGFPRIHAVPVRYTGKQATIPSPP